MHLHLSDALISCPPLPSGNWHLDKKQGYGKYVWSDGDVYDGQWEGDLRNGEGTCTYSNGDIYAGKQSAVFLCARASACVFRCD